MDERTPAYVTDIVASYVATNRVHATDVPNLISAVAKALRGLNGVAPIEAEPQEPAVPLRRLVKDDAILCADCGKGFKTIRRHLAQEHGLTPKAYIAKWGLRDDHPMIAPSYSEKRSALAKEIGLGRKAAPVAPEPAPAPAPAKRARAAKTVTVTPAPEPAPIPEPTPAPTMKTTAKAHPKPSRKKAQAVVDDGVSETGQPTPMFD